MKYSIISALFQKVKLTKIRKGGVQGVVFFNKAFCIYAAQ